MKDWKRRVSILLCVAILLGNFPVVGFAAQAEANCTGLADCGAESHEDGCESTHSHEKVEGDAVMSLLAGAWSGSGTLSDPYLIRTEQDLWGLAQNVNSGNTYSGVHFRLADDITLTGDWTPIGTESSMFCGTFDGNGKTISGMTITGSHAGLFAYVGSGATIKNVNLADFSVTGASYLAGLVVHAEAGTGTITIADCTVSGSLKDNDETYPDGYLAGIVAYANAESGTITISGCTSDGSYSCDYYSGGIVGYGKGNAHSLQIRNCTNNAHIYLGNNGNYCGGIAGYLYSAELESCFNFENVSGNAYSEDNGTSWLGGISGAGGGCNFNGCANYGGISCFFPGGITASQNSGNVANSCLNVGKLTHSSDGYGHAILYIYQQNTAVNCYYRYGTGMTGAEAVGASQLASGEVAHALREYFGQQIGVDEYPVPLTASNRVYKVIVVGEVSRTFYVNNGQTVALPELSSCAAYYTDDTKFDPTTPITRDYVLVAKGDHNYADGTCIYCGSTSVGYVDVGACGDSAGWVLSTNGVLTISGSGAMKNFSESNPAPWKVYASKIQSVKVEDGVTNVGDYAFAGLTDVTAFTLSDTVTSIGKYAFYGLEKLTEISVHDFITDIGDYAFASCTGATRLILNDRLVSIGDYAFYRCEGLDSVSIPGAVKTIGNGAFRGCKAMDYILLADGLNSIGAYAFAETVVESLRIPATVTQIGDNAFANCADLVDVTFLGAAPEIAAAAFTGDTVRCHTPAYDSSWESKINKNYGGNLTWDIGSGTCGTSVNWVVDFNGTLTVSGTGNMYSYSVSYGEGTAPWASVREKIQSVIISEGVTSIGSYAFYNCSNICSVSIADSVTAIGTQSSYGYSCPFQGCTSLTQITIPKNVTTVAYDAFNNCPNLTSIEVAAGNTAFSSNDGILYDRYKDTLRCYPAGKTGAFTIPSSVDVIAPYAFTDNVSLQEITIPAAVTSIGRYAFADCTGLTHITFEGSAPTIDSSAFNYVEATVDVPLSNSTWTADKMKDYGGTLSWNAGSGVCGANATWELVYVNGAAKLTISGTGAMNDYTSGTQPWKDHLSNIRTVEVCDGVTYVGAYALCMGTGSLASTSLTTLKLADSVTSIGNDAFTFCTKLSNVTWSQNLRTIGESAFVCTALTSLTLPDSLQTLGRFAFEYCDKLKTLTFGSGLRTVSYTAFAGCTALQTVDLGNSVTTLEQSAFNGCTSLTKITIPKSVTSVGKWAFRNCTNLQYVEFEGSAPTLDSNAFGETTCNAYYHSSQSGWTSSKLVNYGGTLTWGAISQRGSCGSKAEWILDTNGNLFICGSGFMTTYSETDRAPWYDYRASIKMVSFRGVTSVGAYAFADCPELQLVMFDGDAPSFGTNSFSGTTCEIWYPSTASGWGSSIRKDYGGSLTWRSTTNRGTCGTSAKWALDSNGTLVVLGSGAMTNYTSTNQPWYSSNSEITAVEIGGKITSVGKYAFRNCTALKTATIGEAVTSVNDYVFSGCSSLQTITFHGSAPSISSYAFNGITATAQHPIANTTWTSGVKKNYGGTITWEALCVRHNETVSPAVEPTCTATGLTEGSYCSLCNEILVAQNVIPAKGHYVLGPDQVEVPADTLEADCVNVIICSVCGEVAKEALGHRVLGNVPVEKDPLEITNTSSYPFTLTDGTYYSTNTGNSSSSELLITALYDCSLTLNYGVSSEEDYDKLSIILNGSTKSTISGEVTNKSLTLTLAAGDVVKIRYKKDESQKSGQDRGWVTLVYDPVMVDNPGDVPADTAEPDCIDGVVCKYCKTVVKEAPGHRIIVQHPAPENPLTVTNASEVPFELRDGKYYSNNHSANSTSTLQLDINAEGKLTLNYGVSSESDGDKLIILVNGVSADTISGIVSGKTLALPVKAGDTVTVLYTKDASGNRNDDNGWVSARYEYEVIREIVPADSVESVCGIICSFCQTVVKEGLDHEEVVDEAVVPGCLTSGLTEGKHCSRCNLVLVAQTTIAATGHTEVIDPAVPATQHYTGLTEGSHCSACGYVIKAQQTIAATGSHTQHAVCAERCTHEESHEIVTFNRWSSGTFSSGDYYMTADITLYRDLTITGTAHICLNGHTLTFADGYALVIEQGGSLTICDCGTTGKIVRGTLQGNGDSSMIYNKGTLLIGGGTYAPDGHGVCVQNVGTLTVYGGTFGVGISNDYDDWSSNTTRYGQTSIHNATIRSELYSNDYALFNSKGCTMTIYGGDFSAKGNALWNKGTVDIHGGKFDSLTDTGNFASATISNTGRLDIRNATVTAKVGQAIGNSGEWNSSYTSYNSGKIYIREGCVITSESTVYPAIFNSGNLNVLDGTVSGYIGIENDTPHAGTSNNGGKCYVSGGTITGTHCAILNSGSTSTKYQNGVPVKKEFSRGILEINDSPDLGKVILEYPDSLIVNNNCSVVIDIELDLTRENIVLGDTISGSNGKLPFMNLLNEGYVLLYNYNKNVYLETNHCGDTSSDDLHWKLTPDGKLTIFGSGKMRNFDFSTNQPWNKEKTKVAITEVVMEPGITHIGGSAFAYLDELTKIVIPEGVVSTGRWVFEGASKLEEVQLPSTLTTIGGSFFLNIDPDVVTYNGCEHMWANVTLEATQYTPVEPTCLANENIDDSDCTTAFICSVCAVEMIPARENHTGGTATCTELAKCEVCDKAYGELGHEAVVVPAVEADCENSGLTEGSNCKLCDAVLVEQIAIPAKGHDYQEVVTDPTCEENGFTTYTCHCGDTYTDNIVDALGHYVLRTVKEQVDGHTVQNDSRYPFALYNGWYASTNKSGNTTSTYQICAVHDCALVLKYKVSSERNYDKLQILLNGTTYDTISGEVGERTYEVNLKAGDIVSVRYSKDGSVSNGADAGYFKIESCKTEMDSEIQIPAEEAEPTCTEAVICERCNVTVKEALGHTEVIDEAVAPECENTGLTEGEHCSVCEEVLIEQIVVEALGHEMGEWEITQEATCTEAGSKRRDCSRCDHFETEVIEATGHAYESVVTAPTCTEPGYTTHTCHCGDSYIDTYVDALDHDMGEWETVKEAICTEDGSMRRDCSRCDHFETDVISATGHNHESVVTDPTCTEKGYTTHTCSCGDSYVDTYVDALDHKWDAGVVTKEPTEEVTGTKLSTCERCGETMEETIPKLDHVHAYTSVVTDPTCTERGYTTHTCSCGDSYVDTYVDALGHDIGEWENIEEASCTEDGSKRRDCSRCDYFETDTISATGHNHESVVTDPTCTEQGYTTHACSCGDSYVDTYVDALDHDMGEWIVIGEATCIEDGEKRRDCSRCDNFETGVISATGHNHEPVVTEPTCTEKGYTTHICSCGDSYVDTYVDALDHDMGEWSVIEEATCTEDGSKRRDCSRCDYFETDAISATGHSYESVVTEPTCTEQGYTTHICSCGDSYVDAYVDALDHKWDVGVITKEPTEEATGTKLFTCERCGETREETLPKLDHVHVYTAVVTDPTCTERGYTTHTCKCGNSYVDTYVDALGHDMGEWVVTKEATCTEAGEKQSDCSRCDHFKTDVISATGHNHESVVTAPTCTEKGYTTHTCKCGDSYVDSYVDALDHKWDAGVVTKEPTEEAEGTKLLTCEHCGETREETLPKLDHVHAHTSVVTDPTCTERGYTTHTCSCGDSYVDTYVDALDHDMGEWIVIVEATCIEDGEKRRDCSRCDYFETEVIEATGHKYESMVTDPTCTEKGYTTHTCKCGDSYVDTYVDALGHKWDAGVVTKEPTEEETGTMLFICERCGETKEETIPTLDHVHAYTSRVTDPTCTEKGYTIHTCSCGDSYVDTYVDALGHDMGEWEIIEEASCTEDGTKRKDCSRCDHFETEVIEAPGHNHESVVTDPTCTEQGYTTHTCSCGDSYVDTYVDALDHKWDAGVITKEPTEEATGTKVFTCERCGETKEETLPKLDHVHAHVSVVTDPTCTEKGYTTHTCSCGDSNVDTYVDALGHDMGEWIVIEEATCIEDGEKRRDCSRCDHFETDVISATGHNHQSVVTDPTCTERGYTTHTCACGDSYVDSYVDALDHKWDDGVITKEPTEDVEGTKLFTCERCGETKEETLPKLDHVHAHVSVVTDPTCTEKGYTTHTCSCGDSYVDTYVAALGHDMGEWIVIEEATCTEDGKKRSNCSRCDHFETEVIEASGHNYEVVVTEPTCTEQGYTTHTCSCGDSYVDTYVEAQDHKWGAGVVTKEPTEDAEGTKLFTCERCDEIREETLPNLDHVHAHTSEVTEPTCTEKGYTTHTCACGDSFVDSYVDALEHKWDAGVITKEPTEDATGTKLFTCEYCGETKEETVPKLDHVHAYISVVTDPTYTEKGYTTHTCFCGESYVDSYVDPLPMPEAEVAVARMILGNELAMQFAFPKTDIVEGVNYVVSVTKTYADGREDKNILVSMDQWGTSGSYYYVSFNGIAAKEMGDTINVQILTADGVAVGDIYVDSIREYALRQLRKTTDAKTRTLYVDMLNYGAAAQTYFSYDAGNLVIDGLTEAERSYGTQSVKLENNLVKGDGYAASQLNLASSIQLRVKFNGIDSSMYAIVKFTNHMGREIEARVEGSEFMYSGTVVVIDQVVAADYDRDVTITVYDASGNAVASAVESVASYIARMSGGAEIYSAVAKYCAAAYSYLHK